MTPCDLLCNSLPRDLPFILPTVTYTRVTLMTSSDLFRDLLFDDAGRRIHPTRATTHVTFTKCGVFGSVTFCPARLTFCL